MLRRELLKLLGLIPFIAPAIAEPAKAVKVMASKHIKYDGGSLIWRQDFWATEHDAKILIENKYAWPTGKSRWVGEGRVKPISDMRDYFGPATRHVLIYDLGLDKTLEAQMPLRYAQANYEHFPSPETAIDLRRAALDEWAYHDLTEEQLDIILLQTNAMYANGSATKTVASKAEVLRTTPEDLS